MHDRSALGPGHRQFKGSLNLVSALTDRQVQLGQDNLSVAADLAGWPQAIGVVEMRLMVSGAAGQKVVAKGDGWKSTLLQNCFTIWLTCLQNGMSQCFMPAKSFRHGIGTCPPAKSR